MFLCVRAHVITLSLLKHFQMKVHVYNSTKNWGGSRELLFVCETPTDPWVSCMTCVSGSKSTKNSMWRRDKGRGWFSFLGQTNQLLLSADQCFCHGPAIRLPNSFENSFGNTFSLSFSCCAQSTKFHFCQKWLKMRIISDAWLWPLLCRILRLLQLHWGGPVPKI